MKGRMIHAYYPRYSTNLLFFAAIALLIIIIPVTSSEGMTKAPDFTATNIDGTNYSIKDFRGSPLIFHITNIEIPLCIECEKSLKSQIEELASLKKMNPNAQIVTLNLRKNPYSENGQKLAEKWWKINITWPWIEDIEPYPIGSKYLDYWNVRGGSSNPTIILIDKDGNVAGVYHVYRVGEGEIDGVQSAKTLNRKLQDLSVSQWNLPEGEVFKQDVSFLGMFFLGILTSLAPCSIALMIAVFSYVLTIRRKDEYLQKSTSTSKEGFMMGIAFTFGMAIVFFFLGLFISQAGLIFRDSRLFDLIAGGIMILLGITNFKSLDEIIEPLTSRMRRTLSDEIQEPRKSLMQRAVEGSIGLFKHSAFIGAFTLGVFFALGWAPCALSMVLPVLIWLASQNIAPLTGGMMLFIFGIGHGIPIIPIATFSRAVGARVGEKYVSLGKWTTKFFGLLVIAVGAIYAARYFGFLLW